MSLILTDAVATSTVSAYATVSQANAFLSKRIRMLRWNEATDDDKYHALVEATSWIDRLNFAGDKTESDQPLEFPRGGDTSFPEDIKRACILIAKEMIEGRSGERMIDSVGMTVEGAQGTRNQFNRWYITSHVRAGIASAEAWNYLQPYLRDPQEITFSRIN